MSTGVIESVNWKKLTYMVLPTQLRCVLSLCFEQEYLRGFGEDIWIGLTDVDMEGDWRWINNEPLVTG